MKKIFYLDDSLFQVTVTSQMLVALGYDVTSSRDPVEALAMIGQDAFDCVITDHLMPGMNGVEFMEKLKVDRPDLAVIFLTSNIQKSVEQDAKAKGACSFLTKPATKESLGEALKKVVGS